MGISICCSFMIGFWRLMISLWSLMMVNMRLHMCDSMMNDMWLNFFFGRAFMNILYRNRCQYEWLIDDFKLSVLHDGLGFSDSMSSFHLKMLIICMFSNMWCHHTSRGWMNMLIRVDSICLMTRGKLNLMVVMICAPFFLKDSSFLLVVDRLDKVRP